jgi:hypothetical protein
VNTAHSQGFGVKRLHGSAVKNQADRAVGTAFLRVRFLLRHLPWNELMSALSPFAVAGDSK